jgi:hypothetical protein
MHCNKLKNKDSSLSVKYKDIKKIRKRGGGLKKKLRIGGRV